MMQKEKVNTRKLYDAEGENEYREANQRIQKAVKRANKDWIDT